MLQYAVHNNIIIMKYSSPSIVILSLNSKRIQCFFFARFFRDYTIDDSIVFSFSIHGGRGRLVGEIKGGVGAHYLAEWQDI